MIEIDLTLPSPPENIAFEQAMLDYAESNSNVSNENEFLRFWSPAELFVVLGRSGKLHEETLFERCCESNVPVLRRASGGGTIITGPGCLMYAVVLSCDKNPALRDIGYCHQHIGEKLKTAFESCNTPIELQGHSDLCIRDSNDVIRKFSGNAMRIGRSHLIYHGTILISFELSNIPKYLRFPPKLPSYRQDRDHLDFVTNIDVEVTELKSAIQSSFSAVSNSLNQSVTNKLIERTEQLVESRYSKDAWNLDR